MVLNFMQFALQAPVFLPQGRPVFNKLRIHRDAGHRTHLDALRRIKMPDTFGASLRINLVDFRTQKNRSIGAFGLTHIAVDALVGNDQSHRLPSTASSTTGGRNNMQQIIGDTAI
jgi:hypothetical protein